MLQKRRIKLKKFEIFQQKKVETQKNFGWTVSRNWFRTGLKLFLKRSNRSPNPNLVETFEE